MKRAFVCFVLLAFFGTWGCASATGPPQRETGMVIDQSTSSADVCGAIMNSGLRGTPRLAALDTVTREVATPTFAITGNAQGEPVSYAALYCGGTVRAQEQPKLADAYTGTYVGAWATQQSVRFDTAT